MLITDTASMEYEQLPVSSRGMRTSRKLLREGEALPGVGYYALIVKFHEGEEIFTAPRHRHNFEQIRLGLSGHMDFGPGLECDAGQIGYFPAGAYYGPEKIAGAEQLLVQWSRDWVTRAQNEVAMKELSKQGRWEHGRYYYTGTDGAEQEVDGPQAVWEYTYQRKQIPVLPRYRSPIMMLPDAYSWVTGDGTSSKLLGRFTEDDLKLEMVRWDGTGVARHLDASRTTLCYVVRGSLTVGNHVCREQAVIWSDFGENHHLIADAGTEAILICFPGEGV
jgi:hypothetical protein